jgi:hypothetical protein
MAGAADAGAVDGFLEMPTQASWFETRRKPALLTMRVHSLAPTSTLVLRSPPEAGVSKDGFSRCPLWINNRGPS